MAKQKNSSKKQELPTHLSIAIYAIFTPEKQQKT
jgi:hypothetical protein